MNPAVLISSILGIFIGLILTFFGERIFKISLSATGFGVGFVLAGGIAFGATENTIVAGIAGGILGVITLFIANSAYRTALFVIGFAMAAIIVTYISIAMDAVSVDVQNLNNLTASNVQQMLPLVITGFIASMITGSLVVMFDTPILRLATAIFGAIVFAISGFVLTTGTDALPQTTSELLSPQLFIWGMSWIPLAIVGVVFQFFGVSWLFNFLQIGQASRQERARQKSYRESKRQQMMQQQYGQQSPPNRPSQGNPQQQYGQPPPNQPASQRRPQRRQNPPRKPRS